jgi:hypothetical protein
VVAKHKHLYIERFKDSGKDVDDNVLKQLYINIFPEP